MTSLGYAVTWMHSWFSLLYDPLRLLISWSRHIHNLHISQVGDKWHTDEVWLKINGKRKYFFAILNLEARFWLSKMVTEHKGNDNVAPMFKEAEKMAYKKSSNLISDGAANFHHAWKDQWWQRIFCTMILNTTGTSTLKVT